MKILIGKQIKEADLFTIANEPISSLDLMERASLHLSEEIVKRTSCSSFFFFIGKGNNGGDGLAIARILSQAGYQCVAYCIFTEKELSEDCKANLNRLPSEVKIGFPDYTKGLAIPEDAVIIDSILGSGVRGEVSEPIKTYIELINTLPNKVVSIDLPSGMCTEWQAEKKIIVKADYTFTIEFPKLGMLLPDAGEFCGEIVVVPIGLSEEYISATATPYYYTDKVLICSLLEKRQKFAHKNTYGHALLICGTRSMSGAATLATGSALRSGCGLVTTHLPYTSRHGVAVNYPSALLSLDNEECFSTPPKNLEKYQSIGVGCGLGQSTVTIHALERLLEAASYPLVLDADALNIIAKNGHLRKLIPENSILTPHVGELKRLIGNWSSEKEKLELVHQLSSELKSIIIVKGAYTMICLPDGRCFFNSTGNAGMAKGGSGDVLTGLLVGLLARGYPPKKAALIGVYLHGLAGDLAAKALGIEAMNSQDIIDFIPEAFSKLSS